MGRVNRALNVTGVTWLDRDDELGEGEKTLAQIVRRVVSYHRRRLGVPPNLIQVHIDVIPKPELVRKVWVVPQRHIIRRHYHAVRVDEGKLPSEPEEESPGEADSKD
ncbi:MAG: hypothetical protein GWN58_26345 [Anaerolineae bacterium]|nr:hypothetical protein [Anaerolineae bacterium]